MPKHTETEKLRGQLGKQGKKMSTADLQNILNKRKQTAGITGVRKTVPAKKVPARQPSFFKDKAKGKTAKESVLFETPSSLIQKAKLRKLRKNTGLKKK